MQTDRASRIKTRVCTLVSLPCAAAIVLIGGFPWTRFDSTPARARNDAASAARPRAVVLSAPHPAHPGYPGRAVAAPASAPAAEPAPDASAHCESACV